MDAESAIAAGGGVVAGGGLVVWFAKSMFERLIRQLDAVVVVVSDLEKGHATVAEHTRSIDARVERISGEVTRTSERLESVSSRVEGLSSSYGPRLAALESEAAGKRRQRGV